MVSVKWRTNQQIEAEELEAACKGIRSDRDRLLAATDYLLLEDVQSDKEAVKAYRQALRDVTNQAGFPHDIHWPKELTK